MELSNNVTEKLMQEAKVAAESAYAPYSKFSVGAALLTKTGEIFTGCNIENSSYGLTCCAERVAIFNAISRGCKKFSALAIFADEMPYPCGACLQVIGEFVKNDFPIFLCNKKGNCKKFDFVELMPQKFSL